jgi:hypothetical protein
MWKAGAQLATYRHQTLMERPVEDLSAPFEVEIKTRSRLQVRGRTVLCVLNCCAE